MDDAQTYILDSRLDPSFQALFSEKARYVTQCEDNQHI